MSRIKKPASLLGCLLTLVLLLPVAAAAADCAPGSEPAVAGLFYPCGLPSVENSCRSVSLLGIYPSRSLVPRDAKPHDVCVALNAERKLIVKFAKGFNIGMPPTVKLTVEKAILISPRTLGGLVDDPIDIVVNRKAYDLNPNDLSLKLDTKVTAKPR